MSAWVGTRVLFVEDGDLVTGTVVDRAASVSCPGGWAIKGDRGGIHYGPGPADERWWWTLTEVQNALNDGDEGHDDRWLCSGCGGSWDSSDDDLVPGLRYQCVDCGEVTLATSPRPWARPRGR